MFFVELCDKNHTIFVKFLSLRVGEVCYYVNMEIEAREDKKLCHFSFLFNKYPKLQYIIVI